VPIAPIARPPRLTGSNFAYQHLPFDTFLDDAVALGRERLELWGIAPHPHIPQVGDAEARAVRRRIEGRGLSAYCLAPEQVMYPVNVASPVDWLRAQSIALLRRAAELCGAGARPCQDSALSSAALPSWARSSETRTSTARRLFGRDWCRR
jgi:protein FrlC